MKLKALEPLSVALLQFARDLLDDAPEQEAVSSAPVLETPFSNIAEPDWVEAVALWNAHGRPLIDGLARRDCPACGEARKRRLFESYDGYGYDECEACGCWYVPLRVEASVFEEFFSRCSEARAVAERSFRARETAEYTAACLDRIGGYLDAMAPLLRGEGPGRNLDVGCGLGHSLQAASARGMFAVGTESSAECLQIAHANGLDVRDAAEPLPAGPFRLITFWESLEHISDPREILTSCHDLLEPGGLVGFSVPNLLSPLLRLQRGDCSVVHGGYDTPGHINLFGPESLRLLFDRSGYELLDLDGQYGMNAFELLAYASGRHHGAHDLLAGRREARGLSESVMDAIRWAGPALTFLERMALLSPILVGIACRKDSAEKFRVGIAELEERRRKRIRADIEASMPPMTEVEALKWELATAQQRLERAERDNVLIRRFLKILRDPAAAMAGLRRRK